MAQFKDYTTICNSAPSEFLRFIALRHREKIVQRNLGIIKNNMTLLDVFLPVTPISLNGIAHMRGRWHFRASILM